MAADTNTVMFDVEDFKVYPLLSDSGASPVYGAGIDVPGIAEIAVDPNLVTAELKGDGGRILAKKGRIDRFKVKATYGKLELNLLEVVMGGERSSVTTDMERYRYKGGTQLPYFKAAFQIIDVELGLGEVVCILYKAQMTGGTLMNQKTDEFGQPDMQFEGIGLESTDPEWHSVMMDVETATTVRSL